MKNFAIALTIFMLSGCSVSGMSAARKHCLQRGGKVIEIKKTFVNSSYCRLPDGSFIDEWRLYFKDHLLP